MQLKRSIIVQAKAHNASLSRKGSQAVSPRRFVPQMFYCQSTVASQRAALHSRPVRLLVFLGGPLEPASRYPKLSGAGHKLLASAAFATAAIDFSVIPNLRQ